MTNYKSLQYKFTYQTIIDIAEVDNNFALALGNLCKKDFNIFIRLVFFYINKIPITIIPHIHQIVIDKLIEYSFCKNLKRNLAINLPVGSGKSLIIQYWILWCLINNPKRMFIFLSHSLTLSTDKSREIKEMLCSSLLQKMFSKKVRVDDRGKGKWSLQDGGMRGGIFASSLDTGFTGMDAGNPSIEGFNGALIIDDPLDAGEMNSEIAKQRTFDNYIHKCAPRRRTPITPTILIQQRLAIDDLTGLVYDKEEDWELLKIQAFNNTTKISNWETKYPKKELQEINKLYPEKFASQYQQEPILQSGFVIKREWFNFYDLSILQNQKIQDCALLRFITTDVALTEKTTSDYTVLCSWLIYNKKLYLENMVKTKLEYEDMERLILDFYNKENNKKGKKIKLVIVEDVSINKGLISRLKTARLPIKTITRVKSKLERYRHIQGHIINEVVLLPKATQANFTNDFLKEIVNFTYDNTHKHDDIIDNLIDAVEEYNIFFYNKILEI